jgi:hypothetical protein
MATDIPLQSESEFTSDMVKAVETIAVNVKLGSAEFSSSIDSLSKAIDGLKSSLIDSINSLKASASNVAPSSPSAAPRASQGRSPSSQDPAIARQKEEDKRIKAEVKALNLKTAQERAIFNAKKLQLQIESVNEGKTTRRKKTDADTQQQSIEEVFENVGKGFGDVFAVTKEQVSAMTKSGKKGKKEKPFEMDMGALSGSSVKKEAGKGVDIAPQFIGDIMNASAAWNNVFANAAESASKWKDVFSIADESKPKQTKEFDPGTDFADPIIRILEQTSEEMASVVKAVEYSGGPSYTVQEETTEPYYSPFIGMSNEQAPLVGPTQENEARYNQLQEEDKIIKNGVGNFSVLFEAMFGKMGKSIQNVIATTASGINRSFSDNSPIFDSIKSLVGNIVSMTPRQAASGVASGASSTMGMVGSAYRGIRSAFSGSNTQEDNQVGNNEGFPGGINGDDFEAPRPQTLSSGGTVGYYSKGTKKKSFLGTLFNTIDDVFGGFFGKKKKKKKDDDESIFKPKGTDTVPAMLTPGEEVVKKSAAEKPENKAAIDAMNKSSGGKVGYFAGGTPGGGGKGIVGGLASLALGPVGQAFSVLTGSVKAASDAIGMFGSFVAKNNPAVMEQVNLAMNDLQGVIGRALVPVVQRLIPVLRFLGDGVDFVMKMLMPAITPIANAFATLAIPLIELEAVVAQFLAPAFEIVAVAVEGFAIMLDPVIQLLAEIVESFTQLVESFLGGIPITKLMKDGFEILGQVVKMLVGAIVSVLGLFMSGMGVILQLAGLLISGFGSMVKGIGDLLSYIPGMGTIGSALSTAGEAVGEAGQAIVKSGEDLQKKGEEQRDRGMDKVVEGAENIAGKFGDSNYKMKDNTRYKSGDVTGVGIKKGSSIGAAVRETQSTSISGVGDEVRKQALMAATGAKTQEESLKDISDKLSKDNLRDAFKDGMIAANGAGKGNVGIQGKDPFSKAGHSKPNLAPV